MVCRFLYFRKHVVFGKVVGGLEIVDKMENQRTDKTDRPVSYVSATAHAFCLFYPTYFVILSVYMSEKSASQTPASSLLKVSTFFFGRDNPLQRNLRGTPTPRSPASTRLHLPASSPRLRLPASAPRHPASVQHLLPASAPRLQQSALVLLESVQHLLGVPAAAAAAAAAEAQVSRRRRVSTQAFILTRQKRRATSARKRSPRFFSS